MALPFRATKLSNLPTTNPGNGKPWKNPDNSIQVGAELPRSAYRGVYAPGSIIVQVGDSNTDDAFGRPGWNTAVQAEWYTTGAWLDGCTDVNLGSNGSTIQGWKLSILTATASTTTRGNANAVVNNNPDLIIVSLGTNELITAERRAAEGVEALMQSNFDTLMRFFLDNTKADILLRLPQPFGQPNTVLFGVDFANQAACDAATEQLRRIHLVWKNHSRVRLYDSHLVRFGLNNTSTTTDSLDAETGSAMYNDCLHLNDLGYRRMAEDIADLNTGHKTRIRPQLRATPDSFKSAIWSETMYLASSELGGTIMNLPIDPISYLAGRDAARRNELKSISSLPQALIHAIRITTQLGGQLRLYTAGGGASSIRCFCHASNIVRTMTSVQLSQHVIATPGAYYDQATPIGLSSPFTVDDVGPITFAIDDATYLPTSTVRNAQLVEIVLGVRDFDATVLLGDKFVWRAARAYTGLSIAGFCFTAPSGASTSWIMYHYPGGIGGSPAGISTLTFASGVHVATPAQTVDVAVGDLIQISSVDVTGGGKGFTFSLLGTTPIY